MHEGKASYFRAEPFTKEAGGGLPTLRSSPRRPGRGGTGRGWQEPHPQQRRAGPKSANLGRCGPHSQCPPRLAAGCGVEARPPAPGPSSARGSGPAPSSERLGRPARLRPFRPRPSPRPRRSSVMSLRQPRATALGLSSRTPGGMLCYPRPAALPQLRRVKRPKTNFSLSFLAPTFSEPRSAHPHAPTPRALLRSGHAQYQAGSD